MKTVNQLSAEEVLKTASEVMELARVYAEYKMPDNWDRNDSIQIPIFYNHMINYIIAASQLHIPAPERAEELLKKCKSALGVLSTMCGLEGLKQGKIVANEILKDIIDYLPKGDIDKCLRTTPTTPAPADSVWVGQTDSFAFGETLEDMLVNYSRGYHSIETVMKVIKNKISGYQHKPKDEWVRVEDGLPEDWKDKEVMRPTERIPFVAHYLNKKYFLETYGEEDYMEEGWYLSHAYPFSFDDPVSVTHYRDLPTPPKQ